MLYAIQTIWFERQRFLPGVLAVGLSHVLMALLLGIVIGLVGMVSTPVDMSRADIWVTSPHTPSCDLGLPIPADWVNRLKMRPEVLATDFYIQNFSFWKNPSEGSVLIIVVGCNLNDDTLGPVWRFSREQRILLTEVGAVIVDRNDRGRLGIDQVGQIGEVFGHRVRVVGFAEDMGSMTAPYVLCSLETARQLLSYRSTLTTYLLATCHDPRQIGAVLEEMHHFPKVSAYSAADFSWRSRVYWLTTTKSGVAVWFIAALGFAVGTLVTSQTLYSATIVSIKEFALLRALGAPRWRMSVFVLQQSLVIGVVGLAVGVPLTIGLARMARLLGTKADLPAWLLLSTMAATLVMALLSGLFSLRSVMLSEPGQLLR